MIFVLGFMAIIKKALWGCHMANAGVNGLMNFPGKSIWGCHDLLFLDEESNKFSKDTGTALLIIRLLQSIFNHRERDE